MKGKGSCPFSLLRYGTGVYKDESLLEILSEQLRKCFSLKLGENCPNYLLHNGTEQVV